MMSLVFRSRADARLVDHKGVSSRSGEVAERDLVLVGWRRQQVSSCGLCAGIDRRITGIAGAVSIAIGLIRIEHQRTVVDRVADPVEIRVQVAIRWRSVAAYIQRTWGKQGGGRLWAAWLGACRQTQRKHCTGQKNALHTSPYRVREHPMLVTGGNRYREASDVPSESEQIHPGSGRHRGLRPCGNGLLSRR
jgi:hypothetical protein